MSDDDISVQVTLHPEDSGTLRTVMVGMGKPTVIVQAVLEDGDVVIDVEGSGDQLEVAALLYAVAVAMDPELAEPEPVTSSQTDKQPHPDVTAPTAPEEAP